MTETRKLFDQARSGDADAFWRLVTPHRGLIYSVAQAMLKSHERAQDQLHDTLIHAFRSIGTLRDPERLPSWLYAMTRNHVLDAQRREQRGRKAVAEAARHPRVIPMAEVAQREEFLQGMEAAMEQLPEAFREILALKYMSRCSLEQIAEMLGITESAVKSRLFQARKSLRRLTENQLDENKGQPAGELLR